MLTARNTCFCYKIFGVPQKCLKWPCPLLGLKLTIQVIKSQIHIMRQSFKQYFELREAPSSTEIPDPLLFTDIKGYDKVWIVKT